MVSHNTVLLKARYLVIYFIHCWKISSKLEMRQNSGKIGRPRDRTSANTDVNLVPFNWVVCKNYNFFFSGILLHPDAISWLKLSSVKCDSASTCLTTTAQCELFKSFLTAFHNSHPQLSPTVLKTICDQ